MGKDGVGRCYLASRGTECQTLFLQTEAWGPTCFPSPSDAVAVLHVFPWQVLTRAPHNGCRSEHLSIEERVSVGEAGKAGSHD